MPGPHKGVSTQRTNQQALAKPGINPWKETNRPETGSDIKLKLKTVQHTVRRKSITNCTSDI